MPNHILKNAFAILATLAMTVGFCTAAFGADEDRTAPPLEDLGHGYARQGRSILFSGKRIDQEGAHDIERFAKAAGRKLTLCNNVDAASFQPLSDEYTKDKNKVYYKWISPGRFWVVELPEADAVSFEVLGFNLARDQKHVWFYGSALPGVDTATVELVHDGFVWKDANHVWYQHEKIVGADPETFRHLGSGYYADQQRAYWGFSPIDGADLATFKVLGDSFIAVDRYMVYRSGQQLTDIDPASCKFILHDPYGYQVISDKNGVYLNQLRFLYADPVDFKMIDPLTGRGEEHVFLVDTYHVTPVTVYREGERLIAETVLYETGTTKPLAIIKADVSVDGLQNITLSPAPWNAKALPVPAWQIDVFKRSDLVKRMQAAGDLLGGGGAVAPGDEIANKDAATMLKPEQDESVSKKPKPVAVESPANVDWRLNIDAFDRYLGKLLSESRVPDREALMNRITAVPGGGGLDTEVMPITDGAGGFVDLQPAKGTVQFRVNEALKGKKVKWEFELASDASPNDLGLMTLQPKLADSSRQDEQSAVFLNTIIVKTATAQPRNAGETVLVEGTIGDSASNKGISIFTGPVAIYHLDSAPHTVFWVGLTEAKITGPDLASRPGPAK